jgi:hypothetical protein
MQTAKETLVAQQTRFVAIDLEAVVGLLAVVCFGTA